MKCAQVRKLLQCKANLNHAKVQLTYEDDNKRITITKEICADNKDLKPNEFA